MIKKILTKNNLKTFINELNQKFEIYAPNTNNDNIIWTKVEKYEKIQWDFINSEISPKNFFFPQTESMMKFINKTDDPYELIMHPEPLLNKYRVILNIRPCDAKAFNLLDKIFLQDNITNDIYWKNKREKTILIGLACNSPSPNCFCINVGGHPYSKIGLDLLLIDLDDSFLVKIITREGHTLIKNLSEPTISDITKAVELKKNAEKITQQYNNININKLINHEMLTLYESSIWKEIEKNCLSCAICTYCCPTCHCFDIQDETQNENGRRVRNWDYCMSWLFTIHGSGHNPRSTKKDRIRQRFMHKFKYIPMRHNGEIGCVGCGRCIQLCPVNIDIRKVINKMNEIKKG